MRIISGTFKGKRIQAPSKLPARPTTDFAKESLFNILAHEIQWNECRVLDLFAGIGSISLEALSRHAMRVTAVENHFPTVQWLRRISGEMNLSDRMEVVKADALKFIEQKLEFEFIFADPPYEYPAYDELIARVLANMSVNQALFVLEHRKSLSFAEHANFADERSYGEVRFSFFRK